MSGPEVLIPLAGIFFLFGAPVLAFVVSRVLRHQERMEMLRRGIIPPPEFSDRRAYRAWRKAGSPWPPPGAGQQAPPWTTGPAVQPTRAWNAPEDDPQQALFKGIRLTLIGFAILLGLSFIGGGHGGPWLLGGLIPMFVGIAQVIIALLSGAQLPGIQPRMTFIPPPQPPPPGAPPPPPGGWANGSAPGAGAPPPWAQQPGRPHFEELSKPMPPPDVR